MRKTKPTKSELLLAHKASFLNHDAIKTSSEAGCFFCRKVFPANEVKAWVTERCGGKTAKCPHCDTDSVLASSSGYPLTRQFLGAMYWHWFGRSLELCRKEVNKELKTKKR